MSGKNIKEKWKQVRAAKEEERHAEREIIKPGDTKQPNVCITNVIVAGDKESTVHTDVCEHFEQNQICDNVNCPMHNKNMHYIVAYQKYKQLRKEFFRNLFRIH